MLGEDFLVAKQLGVCHLVLQEWIQQLISFMMRLRLILVLLFSLGLQLDFDVANLRKERVWLLTCARQ
jgi:hypothetical protein